MPQSLCRLFEDLEVVRELLRAGKVTPATVEDPQAAAVAASSLHLPARLPDMVAYLTTLEAKWLEVLDSHGWRRSGLSREPPRCSSGAAAGRGACAKAGSVAAVANRITQRGGGGKATNEMSGGAVTAEEVVQATGQCGVGIQTLPIPLPADALPATLSAAWRQTKQQLLTAARTTGVTGTANDLLAELVPPSPPHMTPPSGSPDADPDFVEATAAARSPDSGGDGPGPADSGSNAMGVECEPSSVAAPDDVGSRMIPMHDTITRRACTKRSRRGAAGAGPVTKRPHTLASVPTATHVDFAAAVARFYAAAVEMATAAVTERPAVAAARSASAAKAAMLRQHLAAAEATAAAAAAAAAAVEGRVEEAEELCMELRQEAERLRRGRDEAHYREALAAIGLLEAWDATAAVQMSPSPQ
jgi:hypothetical protein